MYIDGGISLGTTFVLANGPLQEAMDFLRGIFWAMPAFIQAYTVLFLLMTVSFAIQFAFILGSKGECTYNSYS
jgi:hypothetical protein